MASLISELQLDKHRRKKREATCSLMSDPEIISNGGFEPRTIELYPTSDLTAPSNRSTYDALIGPYGLRLLLWAKLTPKGPSPRYEFRRVNS